MADLLDRRTGGGGPFSTVRYYDEGDGTYSEAGAVHLRAWDPVGLTWVRVAANAADGSIKISGGGSGGTSLTDNAAFTVGTTSFTPGGGTYKSVRSALTDNSAGTVALTAKRAQYVSLETPLAASVMDEANTAVRVNIVAGAGSGGTAQTDKSAFAEGAGTMTPVGGVFNDTISADPTEDQAAALRITAKRGLHINLRTAAGAELLGQTTMAGSVPVALASNQTALAVTGTFWQATQPVSGTFWQATQPVSNAGTFAVQDSEKLADNTAFTDGTTKLMPSGYVFDEVAGTALTENDLAAARLDSKRAQVLVVEDATTRGQRAAVSAAGALKVDGSAVTQPVSGTFWQATQPVSGTVTANLAPVTSGGLTISRVISAASTNATSAKASAGQVYGWYVSNVNAAARYLKLYNKASAPTVGTDTPVMTILIPGNTAGAGATVAFENGIAFGTGIAYALTTGVADSDTGAVAANEIVAHVLYK